LRQNPGTRVYDAADGKLLTNIVAVRFEHRQPHRPVVILELLGGTLAVRQPGVLVLAEREDV
jgi:hypothetical protein